MNYTYEPPKEESHVISVWGKDAEAMCFLTGSAMDGRCWLLKDEVREWIREHEHLMQNVLSAGNDPDDGPRLVYSFRFKTKEAAMLFKLTFG